MQRPRRARTAAAASEAVNSDTATEKEAKAVAAEEAGGKAGLAGRKSQGWVADAEPVSADHRF